MIDADHVFVNVKRLTIPEDKWAKAEDEAGRIAAFHAMSLMATYHDWSEFFTFVALTEDLDIEHLSIDVMDVEPTEWIGIVVGEAIRLAQGRYLAVTLNMGAYSLSLSPDGETTQLESKYCFTVPTLGNVLVSRLHRTLDTQEVQNDGRWETCRLEEATLDADGHLADILLQLQELIKEERANRS
jgi:hypothetical protein